MLKKLILMAALVPTAAAAHNYNQDAQLQRWLANRVEIGNCLLLLEEGNIPSFLNGCDLDEMVRIENRENRALEVEMLRHPGQDAMQFAADHFAHEDDEFIWGVYLNIDATPKFASILVRLYAAEGLTRNAAPDSPEGRSSTVDESPGNDAIHNE